MRKSPSLRKTVPLSSELLFLFHQQWYKLTEIRSWTALPNPNVTIDFTYGGIKICGKLHRDVSAKEVLRALVANLDLSKISHADSDLPRVRNTSFSEVSHDEIIKQDRVWRLLGNFVRPGDIVLGETGTAGYGVREMALPRHTRLFTPCTWLSIGYVSFAPGMSLSFLCDHFSFPNTSLRCPSFRLRC